MQGIIYYHTPAAGLFTIILNLLAGLIVLFYFL